VLGNKQLNENKTKNNYGQKDKQHLSWGINVA
jgi:hypothetical protein